MGILSGILEQLSFTTKFLGSQCENRLFYKKTKCFKCSFYEIEEYVNWPTRLEKHQTIEILLRVVHFLQIFKNIAFSKISRLIEIHQQLVLKWLHVNYFILSL